MNKQYYFNPKVYQLVSKNINKYLKIKKCTVKELCKYTQIKENYLTNFLTDPTNLAISIYDLYKISVIFRNKY